MPRPPTDSMRTPPELQTEDTRTTPELPTGTVTFLFTDIEGSTRLVQALGASYADVLDAQRRILREAAERFGGVEFGTEGDASFLVFPSPKGAVEAAAAAQRELPVGSADRPRVRMGIHTGEGFVRDRDYVGLDVHRVARIAAAGHGGQIVLSEPTRVLIEGQLPAGASLRDLGEHRLKDLNRPEHLYQLDVEGLPRHFPPIRTLDAASGNLPVQLTRFVGRERELEEAGRALSETRLLTLSGPGGTGKTRLSIQLAAAVREQFAGGVWFVPLSSVTDPELVPSVIAETLGVLPVQGDRRSALEMLADHLRDRDVLLVLDNFEQVLDAAPAVTDLLRAAPRLKVVATSRSVLRVSGEREFHVPPLTLPDPRHLPDLAALSQFEAVALFIDRAVAVKPDFAVTNENAPAVAEITARLDGLPLPIELAAARIRLLTPQQMLARLGDRLALLATGPRDLPARQQTLRGAIAWSHDLLTDSEQRMFARLAVFMGGCRLEEAEAVCGPPDDLGMDVLDGLTSLAEKSLVLVQEGDLAGPRFGMLETIREFAAEALEAGQEAEVIRARHAEAYAALSEQAAPRLTKRDGKEWLDRLEPEHDNIRAALEWAISRNRKDLALRMVGAVWRFWQMRGHLHEAASWAKRALALSTSDEVTPERIRALLAAGGIAYWSLDTASIREFYEEALRAAEALGDKALLAEAVYNSSWADYGDAAAGRIAPTLDQSLRARERLERSLALFEELGDKAGMAKAHWGLGDFAFVTAESYDLVRSRMHLEQARDLARQADDTFTEGWSLYVLAAVAREEGDPGQAEALNREALTIFQQANDVTGVVLSLDGLSTAAKMRGRAERALRLAGAAASLRAESGAELYDYTQDDVTRGIEDPLTEQEAARARSEGAAMTIEEAIAYAMGED